MLEVADGDSRVYEIDLGGRYSGGNWRPENYEVLGIPHFPPLANVLVDETHDNEEYAVVIRGQRVAITSGVGDAISTIRTALLSAIGAAALPDITTYSGLSDSPSFGLSVLSDVYLSPEDTRNFVRVDPETPSAMHIRPLPYNEAATDGSNGLALTIKEGGRIQLMRDLGALVDATRKRRRIPITIVRY